MPYDFGAKIACVLLTGLFALLRKCRPEWDQQDANRANTNNDVSLDSDFDCAFG